MIPALTLLACLGGPTPGIGTDPGTEPTTPTPTVPTPVPTTPAPTTTPEPDASPVTIRRKQKGDPPPTLGVSGVAATCQGADQVELMVEYVGVADELLATAHRDGVAEAEFTLEPHANDDKLFKLVKQTEAVTSCEELSWTIELVHADLRLCRVLGPDADDLVEPEVEETLETLGINDQRCMRP